MRSQQNRRSLKTVLLTVGISLFTVLATTGCTQEQLRGYLPGDRANPITNQTERLTNLWVGSWVALLVVGVITWALMIWCVVAYRRRKNQTGLPVQLRYHAPLEMMFTIIPVVLVLVFFYFTDRDVNEVEDRSQTPDVIVNVVGKQWSWDFNYVSSNFGTANVHEAGTQAELDGTEAPEASLPTLYLPAGKSVLFELSARDVIHSFWVPSFLYKKDMIPGHTNYIQITPLKEGTYAGKCAELCGEYHSEMLFNVKVVSPAEFTARMDELAKQGNTGLLDNSLNRNPRPWEVDTGKQNEPAAAKAAESK